MTNALYDNGRNAFLTGSVDWATDTLKVVGVSSSYTVDLAADEYISDIASADRVATVALSGASASAGVADADDATFASVTGDEITALVIYKDTGTETTSPLIAYIDTGTNLPVTPNGGDISISWDSGADKIFKL